MIISQDVKNIDAAYVIDLIRKRFWLLSAILVLFSSLAVMYLIFSPDKYKTTTTFLMEEANSSIPVFGRQTIQIKPREVKDQIRLIKSRTIAERVGARAGVKNIDALLLMADVQIPKNSINVLELSVAGRDPKMIAEIANVWLQEYVSQIREIRKKTAIEGEKMVAGGIDNAVNDLKVAEKKIADFETANPGVSEKAGMLEDLEKKKMDLENRISELTVKYKEEHPKVAALKAAVANISAKIQEERHRTETDWNSIQEYERLSSDVKTLRKLYDDLVGSSKDLKMAGAFMPSNIQIIDEARIPDEPLSKNDAFLKLLIFGIVLALGSTFLAEFFDHSFSYPVEVEFYAKMPVLVSMPFVGGRGGGADDLYKAAALDQTSSAAEAFRELRAFLFFAASENKNTKLILVTGSSGREGKTFVASNLAITFAHAGEKTLLIDADMKSRKLSGVYGFSGGKGLSDVLLAGGVLPHGILSDTSVRNLSILPSGTGASTSADLIGDVKAISSLVGSALSDFQRIVIDVPSVLEHPDILYWDEMCDGIVYVIGKGAIPYEKILEAKKKLKKGESKIIGAVLNDVGAEDYIVAFAKNIAGKIFPAK